MKWLRDLASRIPWWVWPWGAVLEYRRTRLHDLELIGKQARIILRQDREIADMITEVRRLRLGSGEGMPSTQKPDFVIVGIPRPGVGVRVIASQKLGGARFDMTPMGVEPEWIIRARMGRALFVDEPTYPEAIAHVLTVWQNWARQTDGPSPGWQARPQGPAGVKIIEDGRMPPGTAALVSGDEVVPLAIEQRKEGD